MPVRRDAIVDDDYSDRLRCQRRFGCPTCLDPHERVWLVVEQPARSGEAALNGEPLGVFRNVGSPAEFDITDRLRERNELVLEFDFAPAESVAGTSASAEVCTSAGPPCTADELLFNDVRLEIRG